MTKIIIERQKNLWEKYDWFFCTPTTGRQKIVDAVISQLRMLLSSKDARLGVGVASCRLAEYFWICVLAPRLLMVCSQ